MMLEGVNTNKIQIIAVIGSVLLFFFILELIRKKKIKEEYSLLWLFISIIFFVVSLFRNMLDNLSRFVGIAYPPVAFLLILIMAIFLILIQFSIIISKQAENNKNLTQEIGLLNERIEKLKKQIDKD